MVLSDDENNYILNIYETSGKSPRYAAELFQKKFGYNVSNITIKDRWKKAGFEMNSHGGHRRGLSKEQFIDTHKKCRGDIEKIAEESGLCKIHVVNKCRKYDLSAKNIPKGIFSRKKQYYINLGIGFLFKLLLSLKFNFL